MRYFLVVIDEPALAEARELSGEPRLNNAQVVKELIEFYGIKVEKVTEQ